MYIAHSFNSLIMTDDNDDVDYLLSSYILENHENYGKKLLNLQSL